MSLLRRSAFVCLAVSVVVCSPSPASAQNSGADASHWGVSFSVTPKWEMANKLKSLIEEDNAVVDITVSEVTVGLVHGRQLGGDWGVSFVRKPFKDGSGIVKNDQQCFQSNICFPSTESDVMQGVRLTGVEVHKFIKFVNIKNRVQLGLNIAGGIASVKGTIVETKDETVVTNFNPQTGTTTTTRRHTVENHDAAEELVSKFPLAKVEAEAAILVAPGLKLKVAGGLNFPAYSARVGVVYLIGAK
jgi:hypothetical protein